MQKMKPYTLAERLDARYVRLADQAGIHVKKPGPRGEIRLPYNLSSDASLHEQRIMAEAAPIFQDAYRRGTTLFHVTICHPCGVMSKKKLGPKVVRELRNWAARRARRVTNLNGKLRVMGIVDVAWNDRNAVNERSHWSVHLHLLMYWDPEWNAQADIHPDLIHAQIRKAFAVSRDAEGLIGPTPVHVLRIRDPTHLQAVLGYHTGSLALWDHTERRRHRRCRRSVVGANGPEKEYLPPKRSAEFTRLMHTVGPRGFRVLSGLREIGGVIRRWL